MFLPPTLLLDSAENLLSPMLGISASFGTLFLIFGGVMGYASSAASHEHLRWLFSSASALLIQDLPVHEEEELLIDLGKETLQAAGDWVIMHR